MADTAGQSGQTRDAVTIKTVESFLNMLTLLQSFLSNPSQLTALGQQAAQAYAISTAQQAAHDKLIQEAQDAQDTLNTLAAKEAELAAQKAANDADYQSKLNDATNYYNVNLKALDDRSKQLDAQQAVLESAQAKLASDQANLATEQQAVADKQNEQDQREKQLDALQAQINQVKAALVSSN